MQLEFGDRLAVLRGFEAEVVPTDDYVDRMLSLRSCHDFDYIVGSVHHVNGISIDESGELYRAAVDASGGFEPFAERYYDTVRRMIEGLRPEIVGHLDLVKLHAPAGADQATGRIRRAAAGALDAARAHGCILDLNTAAWRKGLEDPYPSPWLVRLASATGLSFCFGDDSHGPAQVGFGLERAKRYLLAHGVTAITVLERRDEAVERREIPLAE